MKGPHLSQVNQRASWRQWHLLGHGIPLAVEGGPRASDQVSEKGSITYR